MKTGSQGTFVIPWSQTETDGTRAAPLDRLSVGAAWRWTGTPLRMDGPQDLLVLTGADGMQELHRRAACIAKRLVGGAAASPTLGMAEDQALHDQSFIVTDGHQTHVLTVLTEPCSGALLVMMVGTLPPTDRDLWIVHVAIDLGRTGPRDTRGVICFTSGTFLSTPTGPRLIDDLRQGDLVLTRDSGPQPVMWRGQRRMTGARLHAMPHLRPIRFRRDALDAGRPDSDLLVSPQHRMLVRGPAAIALFNTPEVLVAAADLINDHSVMVDYTLREVTYIHILLDHHNVIWANGLETESFHPANAAPANTAPGSLDPAQYDTLMPCDPHTYGAYARRNLTTAEAAILRHHDSANRSPRRPKPYASPAISSH